ncbi:hypothetical protein C8J57DRAFT_1257576 [Mycena rebaudengoi]|nr:hypothetical protein C8J57DRAFT_1257576 [Mycena rebaudengoi]
MPPRLSMPEIYQTVQHVRNAMKDLLDAGLSLERFVSRRTVLFSMLHEQVLVEVVQGAPDLAIFAEQELAHRGMDELLSEMCLVIGSMCLAQDAWIPRKNGLELFEQLLEAEEVIRLAGASCQIRPIAVIVSKRPRGWPLSRFGHRGEFLLPPDGFRFVMHPGAPKDKWGNPWVIFSTTGGTAALPIDVREGNAPTGRITPRQARRTRPKRAGASTPSRMVEPSSVEATASTGSVSVASRASASSVSVASTVAGRSRLPILVRSTRPYRIASLSRASPPSQFIGPRRTDLTMRFAVSAIPTLPRDAQPNEAAPSIESLTRRRSRRLVPRSAPISFGSITSTADYLAPPASEDRIPTLSISPTEDGPVPNVLTPFMGDHLVVSVTAAAVPPTIPIAAAAVAPVTAIDGLAQRHACCLCWDVLRNPVRTKIETAPCKMVELEDALADLFPLRPSEEVDW